jgi:peptidoglycan/xylan/chitin deacetylase (PgdA/CDA1 family)
MSTEPGKLSWFPAVMYHRVVDSITGPDPYALKITSADLESQLKSLRDGGYRSVPLQEALASINGAARPSGKQVVLTFDDGYMDFMTHALPLLQEYAFTATVYLVSDQISGTNKWDEGRAEPATLMGPAEIREAQAAGITFGSHSKSHLRMADLPLARAREEVFGSKKALEDLLGMEVPLFCYPFGNSSAPVREAVREAGYSAALGIEQREHDLFNLSRVDGARSPGAGFKWKFHISGRYFWLRNRASGVRGRLRKLKP